MRTLLRDLRDILCSLKFTVALLALSIVLVLAATLDQVNIGVWAVQAKYFHAWAIFWPVGDLSLAIFPGGYTLGALLLANLAAAHLFRFKLTWRKSGIYLVHSGLIVLLLGELFTGLFQNEYHLRIAHNETKNYAESYRRVELALVDTTDPDADQVTAIPEAILAKHTSVQHPALPFRVAVRHFYPNSTLQLRRANPHAAPSHATAGVGPQLIATPQPLTYKQDERNMPSAFVDLIGPDGSLGTYLVSTLLLEPQRFEHAGRIYEISLRFARHYLPFSLTLLKFTHDRYAGTNIPKNFSSRVRLTTPDGIDDREVLIFMNNPLRYAGLTFYQAGFENNDTTSILQVVRNPSWLLPYIACVAMTLGFLIQFGIHLFTFDKRRSSPSASQPATPLSQPKSALKRGVPEGRGVSNAPNRPKRLLPFAVLLLATFAVLATLRTPNPKSEYDLTAFGRLPTLVNGRLKPLDTVARTSLLVFQGRQRVTAPDGRRISPTEWLLDVFFRPDVAQHYQTFEIIHPDVLALLNLSTDDGTGGKRFSYRQISHGLVELDRQGKLAEGVESALRTPFQRAVLTLRQNLVLYQRLQHSLDVPRMTRGHERERADENATTPDFLTQLSTFEKTAPAGLAALRARRANEPHEADLARAFADLSQGFATIEAYGYLLPIPPVANKSDPLLWRNLGVSLRETLAGAPLNPAVSTFASLGLAWRNDQPDAFNTAVHTYRASLESEIPSILRKTDVEARFNSSQPFYTATVLYVLAFLFAVFSWLRWPDALGRSAFSLLVLAFVLTTAGIAVRMWLENRPPVTNLYSSALFVGWGAVALCVLLERIYKNAIGSVAAGIIGFATLLIAHHLSLGGDTLEMMRAVLDSNFWLATHVVTIAIGYSATFLAGALALIYVFRGLFTKSLDPRTADTLARMVYGIVCFATLFSFVGTVLGGIWADQSWGRFWGWDPKENGALIIVLWNSLILHARWGGMIKARGLMVLAIFGNLVTAWSWFGVNMLGVGLHSYGFMESGFRWLLAFALSQLLLMLLAATPLEKWRSPLK